MERNCKYEKSKLLYLSGLLEIKYLYRSGTGQLRGSQGWKRARPQKASPQQKLCVEEIDGEWYVTSTHPMSKEDYISFVIFVSGANLQVFEQYPEWPLQARIPKRGHGTLLWYSKKEGLYYQLI